LGGKLSSSLRTAELRGLKTAWLAEGPDDAPLLLLLHGYPDTAHSWSKQIDYFKSKFRVIAPFTRGAQPSEASPDTERYSLDSGALDQLAILRIEDPLSTRPIYLVGHDIGGCQAWHLAALLGERLHGLTIINSLPLSQMIIRLRTQPSQWLRSWYIYPFLMGPVADPLLRRFPNKILALAHQLGKLAPQHRPKLAKALPGVVNPVKHYRALLRAIPAAVIAAPRRLRCPVMILWGEDEPFLTRIKQEEVARYAERPIIRVLRGGHWLHREDAERVNQLLEEFLC
jgi:pimeloyl-ACP methyl ester carboxylesterase